MQTVMPDNVESYRERPRFTPGEIEPIFARPRSVDEIAEWIDCTPKFLRTEIFAGRLRARKLSKRFGRIMPSDLRAWLDQASTTAVE